MFTYRILRGKYHLTWAMLLYLVQISHICRITLSKDAEIGTDALLEFLTKHIWQAAPEWQNRCLRIGLFAVCTIRTFTCVFIKWQLCVSWEMCLSSPEGWPTSILPSHLHLQYFTQCINTGSERIHDHLCFLNSRSTERIWKKMHLRLLVRA